MLDPASFGELSDADSDAAPQRLEPHAELVRAAPSLPEDADTKFDALNRVLRELHAQGRQALLFTHSRPTLAYLKGRLGEDFRVAVMHGGVSREDRRRIMAQFRAGGYDFVLANRVASEGLNFEFCSAVINYDLPWNPIEIEQRIGRIDRSSPMRPRPPRWRPPGAGAVTGPVPPVRAGALLREQLQAPRDKSHAPVLGTLQPDRYNLVTAPAMTSMIVEGQPGTGKAIIASHRAAYLINDETPPDKTLDGRILLVGPTDGYTRHVRDVIDRLAGPTGRITIRALPAYFRRAAAPHVGSQGRCGLRRLRAGLTVTAGGAR